MSECKTGVKQKQRGAIDEFFSVKDAYLLRKCNLADDRESSHCPGKRPKTLQEMRRSLVILKGTSAVKEIKQFLDLLTSANVSENNRYEILNKFVVMFKRIYRARHVVFALEIVRISQMSDDDVQRLMFMEAV